GQKYTVPIPEPTSTAKGEETEQTTGTVIGAENMETEPASEITFNDDQTELLGDSPSMQADEIDLGVDNVEASADAAEAGMEEPEGEEISSEEEIDVTSDEGGESEEGGDELGLGDEEGGDELGLGDEEEESTEESSDEDYDKSKDISEEGDDNDEAAEEITPDVETPETAPEELEKSDLSSEDEVEVEDVDVKEKPANAPRVFLKKKNVSEGKVVKKNSKSLNESFKTGDLVTVNGEKGKIFGIPDKKNPKYGKIALVSFKGGNKEISLKDIKKLNENAQIGDTVTFDKKKGYVIGQTGDGDLIIQIQGSTEKVKPTKVKAVGKKSVVVTEPPYKFDKNTLQNLTTKSLFEQYVQCGIFMGNTPVKTNNCYVKFNEWNDAENEKTVSVIVEGSTTLLPKSQIKIFEDVNDFANPDNYVEGSIINEESGEIIENVLINMVDYTQTIGDSDEVRIVRKSKGKHIVATAPIAILKTK
ncbi:hypothetical protein KY334_05725, partial [Candidatus Woesearchaeota archaeon]|nr:hypothetical protein [Candidatus Woesearchaeota archaeon]